MIKGSMSKWLNILFLLLSMPVCLKAQDSLRFSGQFSSWMNMNTGSELPVLGGVRYIPQGNFSYSLEDNRMFDTELSVNIYGNAGLDPFDTVSAGGDLKPYRAWIRYSSSQMEIRLGLQKLNFGSSVMMRPLMWFDQMDSRDPLQLTDGVWGAMARYYFLNNTNIWLWLLYGNDERRGWEIIPANARIPEIGGRIQIPVPAGEAAVTYHHRTADSRGMTGLVNEYELIPENKYGFDAKWDLTAGLWIETSYTHKRKDIGILTNQLIMNAGIDYTFSVGNGIYAAFEQLMAAFDEKPFSLTRLTHFSMMTCNYPVGLFDKLSTIFYYNWTDRNIYSFLNWQKQFDNIMLYLIGFWNPRSISLPALTGTENIFAGKGIQVMFVFNH